MKGFLYIIESESTKNFYIGSTNNLARRLDEHNRGHNKSTRLRGPWKLIYTESFETLTEARARELAIKKKKRKSYIAWLTSQKNAVVA